MSEQLQDQIDRYLGGEMSPGEKEEFLVHAETNAQLREQLDETRSAQLALVAIDFEEKLDFVKGLESEEEGVVPIHKSRRKWYWLGGVAASFLAIIIVWNEHHQEELRVQRIIDEHFVHVDSDLGTLRSGEPDQISLPKKRAYNLYELKKYEISAPLLEQVYFSEKDTASLFFAGVAYLGFGEVHKTEELLEKSILSSDDSLLLKVQLEKISSLIINN